jgi:hypothetical protein
MCNKDFFIHITSKPNYIFHYNKKKEFYYNLIQYELDQKMYYYGENFRNHDQSNLIYFAKLKNKIKQSIVILLLITQKILSRRKKTNLVWNSAYFNFDNHFKHTDLKCVSPPWHPRIKSKFSFDLKLYNKSNQIKQKLDFYDTNELVTNDFFDEIDSYLLALKKYVIKNNIVAVFLPHTIGFFEKAIISVFNELQRPTFLFNHGLPYYWKNCDNLADYFVVWGSAIKNNYINSGYPENKILISGHPLYKISGNIFLKFNFDNILILTKAMNGVPSYDEYTLRDRSHCILYLNMIQSVLESFGVTKVRLRPHPSENIKWYLKYLDKKFYTVDIENLSESLNLSSLVIGPTSSVFLESLLSGVNYVVFEPTLKNDYSFDNVKLVPPFDNSDNRVPCANDIDSLKDILKNKTEVDCTIIKDYCSDKFEVEMITKIITNNIGLL